MTKKENRTDRLMIRIRSKELAKIKQIALQKDVSVSQLIREIIFNEFNF